MMRLRSKMGALAAAAAMALGLVAGTARADVVLAPGGVTPTLVPENVNAFITGGPLVTQSIPYTASAGVNVLTGILTTSVYRDVSGNLDFLYQITNTTPGGALSGNITDLAVANYGNALPFFTTSVGDSNTVPTTNTANFAVGTVPALFASRPLPGTLIDFSFVPAGGTGGLTPGTTSNIMFVRTNATAFNTLGSATISGVLSNGNFDSNAVNGVIQPTLAAAIPEPGVMALSSVALVTAGLGALARRRRASK